MRKLITILLLLIATTTFAQRTMVMHGDSCFIKNIPSNDSLLMLNNLIGLSNFNIGSNMLFNSGSIYNGLTAKTISADTTLGDTKLATQGFVVRTANSVISGLGTVTLITTAAPVTGGPIIFTGTIGVDTTASALALATQGFVTRKGYRTGNETITLLGDVTGTGTSAITTAIGTARVTNLMLQNSTISGIALGGILPALTLGYGLTGTTYNGVLATTAKVDTSINTLNPATQGFVTRSIVSNTGVTAVTASVPLASSGGTAPNITADTSGGALSALHLATQGFVTRQGYLTGNQSISFAPTGDVTGSTTGTTTLAPALTIGALKVTNAMLSGSITAAKLVGTDITSVGTLSGLSVAGNISLTTAGNKLSITEGVGGRVGQTTLVLGTIAVAITGLTTSSRAFVQLVTPTGTIGVGYKAVCTANLLTITALTSLAATQVLDLSNLNYFTIN